jgi:hypothetical protein
MIRPPFGPQWGAPEPPDVWDTRYDDADLHDTDPPFTRRRSNPVPPPCPVCLKHVGHYDDRHNTARDVKQQQTTRIPTVDRNAA